MKKLSKIEEAIHIKENDLFGDDNMQDVDKIQTYCQELLGADFVPEEGNYGRKLKTALVKFVEGANDLLEILEELDGADILPTDTEGSLPEPEEIIALLK
jgi:hypothetical protein